MFNVKNMLVQNRSCDKIKERGLITVHPLSWYRQTPYSRIQAKSPRIGVNHQLCISWELLKFGDFRKSYFAS